MSVRLCGKGRPRLHTALLINKDWWEVQKKEEGERINIVAPTLEGCGGEEICSDHKGGRRGGKNPLQLHSQLLDGGKERAVSKERKGK